MDSPSIHLKQKQGRLPCYFLLPHLAQIQSSWINTSLHPFATALVDPCHLCDQPGSNRLLYCSLLSQCAGYNTSKTMLLFKKALLQLIPLTNQSKLCNTAYLITASIYRILTMCQIPCYLCAFPHVCALTLGDRYHCFDFTHKETWGLDSCAKETTQNAMACKQSWDSNPGLGLYNPYS